MASLPRVDTACSSKETLDRALSILFEPSAPLSNNLVPQIYETVHESDTPRSYADLIEACGIELKKWPLSLQASFIESHPRIGEVEGLSALSAQEQASKATPPEVLSRLEHLNAMYERRYTGLRYVVFVNNRSREQIMHIMEQVLLIGPAEPGQENEPPLDGVMPLDVEDAEWQKELHRAVSDVLLIAKARLGAMGVE